MHKNNIAMGANLRVRLCHCCVRPSMALALAADNNAAERRAHIAADWMSGQPRRRLSCGEAPFYGGFLNECDPHLCTRRSQRTMQVTP